MALESAVRPLEATVQQVTEPLRQDARTSSRPPSRDPPQAIGKRPRRQPSGRRPGGQPGHEGQTRALLPVEEVDVSIPVKPTRCLRCQQPLPGEDLQPQRQQVTESPPAHPVVTEYQWHRLVCPVGGERTRAELPPGGPPGALGPRMQAIAALCTGAYHRSTRATQSVLADRCGVSLRLGTLAHLEQATAQAVAAPVAAARSDVHQQPVASLDATGWREGPHRAWLWTAVTAGVTGLVVRLSRRGQVAQELLGTQLWGGWSRTAGVGTAGTPPGGASAAGRICCGILTP
jgi:transposase